MSAAPKGANIAEQTRASSALHTCAAFGKPAPSGLQVNVGRVVDVCPISFWDSCSGLCGCSVLEVLEDLGAELKSTSVEVSQLELNFCNALNIFLRTHGEFWLLLLRTLSLSQSKTSRDPSKAYACFQKGKLRHSGVRHLGWDYTGIGCRAMVGPSLHLAEFVRVPEHGEGDGAAAFVTSRGGPGKRVPILRQSVPWERGWRAGMGSVAGRPDGCWLPWHQESHQISGCW